jgi:circadian clock protein KaiB
MTGLPDSTLRRYEERLAASAEQFYELSLFVSGASDLAARAIANARQLCEIYLVGHYHLSVIDVHEDVEAVRISHVLATPTLVRNLPLPVRRVVGDLSHTDRVLHRLDLPIVTAALPGNG